MASTAGYETAPVEQNVDTVCPRCGGPVEVGQVTGGAGWFGFAGGGMLGWLPRTVNRWRRHGFGTVVREAFVGPARAQGYRCGSCRLIWFGY
jgi:predicted RNA-binding Zn-ribbon protein involved in translation (DUF1610 family)